MPNSNEILQFTQFYFEHPYWRSAKEEPRIRLSFLPSETLRARVKKQKGVAWPSEHTIREGKIEDQLASIVSACEKGFDCYYFCNVVRSDLANAKFVERRPVNFAENKDVIARLFLPVDLDYRLPVTFDDFATELGLSPAVIIETSRRGSYPHHQMLFGIQDDWDALELGEQRSGELTRAVCSDSVTDAKRILRLPGTLNWKHTEKTGAPTETRLVKLDHRYEYLGDIEDAAEKFEGNKLRGEIEQLIVRPIREGGISQGIKGEWGPWEKALKRGEAGEVTVIEGGGITR